MAHDLDMGGPSDDAAWQFDGICLVRGPDLDDRPACWNQLQARLETEPGGTGFIAEPGEAAVEQGLSCSA